MTYNTDHSSSSVQISVITPAYNEETNLPVLHDRVCTVLKDIGVDWERIIIDDHSSDGTWSAIQELGGKNGNIRGLRLSHNSGSHRAMICGLTHSRGDCVIVLAADLQDPPETIPLLLEKWRHPAFTSSNRSKRGIYLTQVPPTCSMGACRRKRTL